MALQGSIGWLFRYQCVQLNITHRKRRCILAAGYPNNDFSRVGPQPTTFSVSPVAAACDLCARASGQPPWTYRADKSVFLVMQGRRALDFVLKNQVGVSNGLTPDCIMAWADWAAITSMLLTACRVFMLQGMIDKTLLFDIECVLQPTLAETCIQRNTCLLCANRRR